MYLSCGLSIHYTTVVTLNPIRKRIHELAQQRASNMLFAMCSAFQTHLLFLIIVGQHYFLSSSSSWIAHCSRSSSLSSLLILCWLTNQLNTAQTKGSIIISFAVYACKLAGPLDSSPFEWDAQWSNARRIDRILPCAIRWVFPKAYAICAKTNGSHRFIQNSNSL